MNLSPSILLQRIQNNLQFKSYVMQWENFTTPQTMFNVYNMFAKLIRKASFYKKALAISFRMIRIFSFKSKPRINKKTDNIAKMPAEHYMQNQHNFQPSSTNLASFDI